MKPEPASILRRIGEIPPLAPAVVAAMEALTRGTVDYLAIERLLQQEPVVSAQVLRLANSPFFGLAGSVGSLREACLVLGSQTLRHVVLAAAALAGLGFDPHGEGEMLWRHSLAVAAGARELAKTTGCDQDLAAVAALLHDLGLLALQACCGDAHRQTLEHSRASGLPIAEAERQLLGFDHCDVGAEIAREWHLPDRITRVIASHHQPDRHRDRLVDVVHLADVAAEALFASYHEARHVPAADREAFARLAVGWSWLDQALPAMAPIAAGSTGPNGS